MKYIHHRATECTENFKYLLCFINLRVLCASVVNPVFWEFGLI